MKKEFKIGDKVGTLKKGSLEEFVDILIEEQQLYRQIRLLGKAKREFWAQVQKDFDLPPDCIFSINNETGVLTYHRKMGDWEKKYRPRLEAGEEI